MLGIRIQSQVYKLTIKWKKLCNKNIIILVYVNVYMRAFICIWLNGKRAKIEPKTKL